MKNTIVFGGCATGKTYSYFIPALKECQGNLVAFSFYDTKVCGIQTRKIEDLSPVDHDYKKSEKLYVVGDLIKYTDPMIRFLKNLLEYQISFKEQILLAIDDFGCLDLCEKLENGKTLLHNLMNAKNIDLLIIVQDLEQDLQRKFRDEFDELIAMSDVVCPERHKMNMRERDLSQYSGELRVRLPKTLHKRLKDEAKLEGLSMNQYVIYKLTQSINWE